VLLSIRTHLYVQQSLVVPDVVPCDHYKDINLPHVEFATSALSDMPMRETILRMDNSWTSLNHLKNVLLGVNQWYHLPFRLHSNTWKTINLTHCLVNTRKYTPRRNPSVGKTPLVFVNSITCIAIAKPIHKMHVTIFHMGKHKRHFYNSSQVTVRVTNVDTAVAA